MMKRCATLLIAALLTPSIALAQTPAPPAPDNAKQSAEMLAEAREMQWTGGAMMVGGIIYEILGETVLAQENTFCTGAFNFASCTTIKDPNMGAVWGGAIMGTAGSILLILGNMKAKRARALAPEVTFTKGGFVVQKRLTF